MTWYQFASLLIAMYFSWSLLVPLYNLINGKTFEIGLTYRLFFIAIFMNLALSFMGTPW